MSWPKWVEPVFYWSVFITSLISLFSGFPHIFLIGTLIITIKQKQRKMPGYQYSQRQNG